MKRCEIKYENGENIVAVHHEADSNKWVFFAHGFGSNKGGSYLDRCEKIQEQGWNSVRFDFRGNGESGGDFSDQNLSSKIEDLRKVVEYFEPEKFVLFGSSFGGKTTYHSLKYLDPVAVVLKAPVLLDDTMTRYKDIIQEKGEWSIYEGKTVDMRFAKDYESYSFEENLENAEIPFLIFHGAEDNTVEFDYSAEAIKKLPGKTTLEKLPKEQHSFSDNAEDYMNTRMVAWLHNNGF